MADTLREVAQEAVAKTERSTFDYKTDHGKQVAGALRAEADRDVFTTLQIAAGEQVSPAILRANLEVSIGILKKDGTIDHRGPGYQGRYDRAVGAIKRAETYFDDQVDFGKFLTSPEGRVVVESTGKFLLTHPALTEYFANITNTAQRENAAKLLAEQYLQDPFAREKVRQALLDSKLNKGEVGDDYSETEAKREELDAKAKDLDATIKKIEAEIKLLQKRRGEFDRIPDPKNPTTKGKVYEAIELIQTGIASKDAVISAKTMKIESDQNEIAMLRAQFAATDKSETVARNLINSDILKANARITKAQGEISAATKAISTEKLKIDALEAEKRSYDSKLDSLSERMKNTKEDKQKMSDELRELTMRKTRLEAGKVRTEELAVAEIENIFKKGVEQELMDRLDRAKAAADKAMEESAANEKDIDEKQYLELRAKRHKTADGKIDGEAIKEDFAGMMRTSTEYHIVRNTDNTVHISAKKPDGSWEGLGGATPPTTNPPGSETYYLTGPEFAILQMMNKTNEFGTEFMLGKLKDTEWMQKESQDFAAQVLREKMYASRGWLRRLQTGVKRLTSAEIVKIKNSTWGGQLLENALEANKTKAAELDKALGSELLTGPGSWREKLGKLSNKQIGLLMLLLGTSGALLAPALTFGALASAGSALGTALGSSSTAGAIAGGGAGLVIGHAGRSRTT